MLNWRKFSIVVGDAVAFAWGAARRLGRRPYLARVANGRLPKTLAPQALYILREGGEDWQASMRCPCGCGATIELNLLTDERPCWHVTIGTNNTPTLKPSVWRHVGCGSHFFLRRGRIVWCY
jgi:Family of unknown function (DUF6527)